MEKGGERFILGKVGVRGTLTAETVAGDCSQDHPEESQDAIEIGQCAWTGDARHVFGKETPCKTCRHEQKNSFLKYQNTKDSGGEQAPAPVSIKRVRGLAVQNPNRD